MPDEQDRFDRYLDAKGIELPVACTQDKTRTEQDATGRNPVRGGDRPHSVIDFEAYCARTGHEILGIDETDGIIGFTISRAENPRKI